MSMNVIPTPCQTCPYRKDCPSGIWHQSEYDKLPGYDSGDQLHPFLCHQTIVIGEQLLCRGWLSVHKDSIAVRILLITEKVTPEQVYEEPTTPLFPSGAAAAKHGKAKIKRPGAKARKLAEKLLNLGDFKRG